ncbi:MAG: response regulator transcription factor [Clostridia bacterium]|nr:response regulator transcription factor [Clostridia bacterium]
MFKIAICDDSRTDVERLECAFDELPDNDLEYEVFYDAAELLKCRRTQNEKYHLYIFDIEMPDMNGLQLAEEIRREDARALFVFLTSYEHYVMEVFDVVTFDYISKPITTEKLAAVLQKAKAYLNLTRQDFVFQYRKNQFRVCCDDILYIEKKGRQAVVHTLTENYKTNMNTDEIWEQLNEAVFSHIHVSYIVNLGHIRAVDKDEVILDNEERLLIARSQKQTLKEKHMNYMKGLV